MKLTEGSTRNQPKADIKRGTKGKPIMPPPAPRLDLSGWLPIEKSPLGVIIIGRVDGKPVPVIRTDWNGRTYYEVELVVHSTRFSATVAPTHFMHVPYLDTERGK